MDPHRQIFDSCHGQILRNYPPGEARDEVIATFRAIRSRPLKDCAMMRIGDFIPGGIDKEDIQKAIRNLNYLCSNPAAVLNGSGVIQDGNRRLRLGHEAFMAALGNEPVHHPLTGEIIEDAARHIQPVFDLRPEALIDKLCTERDLNPGPGRPGIFLICPDDHTAKALAAHAGWSLTTDEPEEDPAITRGAILRAMRNGTMVFAAMEAIPEGLHLAPALLALHPEFSTDEALSNRAGRIIDRISAIPDAAGDRRHTDAELVAMARAFSVDDEHEIVSRGKGRWAITRGSGSTLNTDFEWEYEPMSSNRDDDYLARNRFSLEEAFTHLEAWLEKTRMPGFAP